MAEFFDIAVSVARNHDWLVAANLVLAVLLALWVTRYRILHSTSQNQQQNFRELIENLSEGIYRSTPDGRQLMANSALVRLNGYDTETELLAAVGDIAKEWYVEPGRRDVFKSLMEQEGKVVDFVSQVYRHRSREKIWVSESARIVRDPASGKPLYYEGSVRDITQTVERLKLEEQFGKLTREVPGVLFQFSVRDAQTSIQYLSPGFERITGIPIAEMTADPTRFTDLIPPEDQAIYREALRAGRDTLSPLDFEHRLRTRDGEEKWLRVSATPEINDDAVVWHGHMAEVTQRKANELAIAQLAYFDALTRLPNRRMFQDRMALAVENCTRLGQFASVLFIDLDNFKTLNDTQGHDVGDEFLKHVARRLQRCVGDAGIVARLGGDEFVVLANAIANDEARATLNTITLGNRLLGAMREPFQLTRVAHSATASVGAAVFDGSETDVAEILKRADIAMYQVKATGRDGLALFDPVSMSQQSDRYKLLADLRTMLGRGGNELEVHYQPKVDTTGRIVAAEALVRWNHPVRGMIYPDRFVPICEQFGLICDLTRVVMENSVRALARWNSDGRLAHLSLALNVSVQSFTQHLLMQNLVMLLERHGVDAARLTLEVTERVMAQDQQTIARQLGELKKLGVRLSLDDFGTGYSSLACLRSLPFDELKVDGSFVADIEHSDSGRAMVKTILAMAQTLGLSAVAEHVETLAQESFLRANGCEAFQGYRYGRALPIDAFEALLHQQAVSEPGRFQIAMGK